MAALLTANGISKHFGEKVLFENLNFNIDETSKIGFIGSNGAGKTTLFRILTGEEDCDGVLVKNSALKVGYMEQTVPEAGEEDDSAVSAYDYTLSVFSRLLEIERNLEEIQHKIVLDGDIEALIKRQDELNNEYLRSDGMTFRAKTRSMLLGLGFSEEELEYPLSKLSGGQKTRLGLARALLSDANLLLLDEPTNHLDIAAITFLEEFLQSFNRSFIVISHDRYFLDKVTNTTFELENGTLTAYSGNYSVFVRKKEAAKEAAKRKYDNTVAEIKRIEGIIEQQKRWNRERNIKTAEHKQKSIDRLEKNMEKPFENDSRIIFRFPISKRSGNDVLTVTELSKSYGSKALFKNASFEIKRGDRVFLLGANGCGKSTLYNIIKGVVPPDSGLVKTGANIDEAFYDQNRSDMSGEKTVIDTLWDEYPRMTQTEIRNNLAAFLFCGDEVFKTVDCLSGGEKARLALLSVMLTGANFLLLDEPTNHLDIAAREALEKAIEEYDGTVFIISHDRYLINKLSTKLLVFENESINTYNFSYDEYIEYKKANKDSGVKQKAVQKETSSGIDYRRQKELQSSIRRLETKIKKLEAEISESENKVSALNDEINNSGSDFEKIVELSALLKNEEENLENNMSLWEEATEELEKLKNQNDIACKNTM